MCIQMSLEEMLISKICDTNITNMFYLNTFYCVDEPKFYVKDNYKHHVIDDCVWITVEHLWVSRGRVDKAVDFGF